MLYNCSNLIEVVEFSFIHGEAASMPFVRRKGKLYHCVEYDVPCILKNPFSIVELIRNI